MIQYRTPTVRPVPESETRFDRMLLGLQAVCDGINFDRVDSKFQSDNLLDRA